MDMVGYVKRRKDRYAWRHSSHRDQLELYEGYGGGG